MPENAIRPIRSEEDYETALARVAILMENSCNDVEDDELEVLLTLVENYENKHYPMDAPDPITAIKFRMEQLGKKQSDLVHVFGSRSKVSEVLNGKRSLTLSMIRALNEHLGIPFELLMRSSSSLPDKTSGIPFDRFPFREMVKLGWFREFGDVKDRSEEACHWLLERAGGRDNLPQALFRQCGTRANAKMDVNALQAWCLYVLGEARMRGLNGDFESGSLDNDFLRSIATLSARGDGPRLARDRLASHGIALVIAKHLQKTFLDGAAMWTAEGVPVVGLTLRYDRLDNFWFCLMHELAHLSRHFDENSRDFFVDDLQLRGKDQKFNDTREQEADQIAEDALIPPEIWENNIAARHPSPSNVISLANAANVHPAVVAGRIRFETKNYRLLSHFVGSKEPSAALIGGVA